MRGDDDERPEEGQHITLVDTITATDVVSSAKKRPHRMVHRITLGSGRNKVTATFFNANYIMKDLVEDAKVMLSGEVGYLQQSRCS